MNKNLSVPQVEKEFKEYQKSAGTINNQDKIITRTCTFHCGDLNAEMNTAAGDHVLLFRQNHKYVQGYLLSLIHAIQELVHHYSM